MPGSDRVPLSLTADRLMHLWMLAQTDGCTACQ